MPTAEQLHAAFYAAKGEPAPPMSYLVRMRRAEQAAEYDRLALIKYEPRRCFAAFTVRQEPKAFHEMDDGKRRFWTRVAWYLARSGQEGVAA